ncbi:YlmH family RNA-binding protein [Marinicrinis sediminis]|uniref:RNA-binding protein n=1 Tax=Marinicrinis sediminis TaxID=1652465 RepID=A0ABW5RBC7_9BACL
MSKSTGIHEHFKPEEAPFVDRVLDWMERVEQQHMTKETDFLDPRQIQIVQSLANRFPSVQVLTWGGYADAERQRMLLAPDYAYLTEEDVHITLLSVTSSDTKFADLQHGDFLGAILGLGMKRDKMGDLHIHEQGCHYIVAEETASFLDTHLRQVHRVQVFTEVLPITQLITSEEKVEELTISVASLRLDGVMSDAVRMSRAKILPWIKSGKCKVNWKVEENPSILLQPGDMLSLKGYGRFKLLDISGPTKSGRHRVTLGKYV